MASKSQPEDASNNNSETDASDSIVKELAHNQIHRLTVTICALVVLSYVVGYFQLTFLIPVLLCLYAVWIWKLKTNEIHDWFFTEHEMREHRRRALEHAETAEWFNFLLNRWWFFSDETINALLKKSLDPILESCKPRMVESIELEKFSLGNRTPYLKYFRVYDLTEDQRKMMATEVIYRNPPVDLPIRPKYQIAVDADFGLDSPEAQLVIRLKMSSKLGFTDVVIDKFKIRGRIQLILQFNQNIQFPHLAAVTFSFQQEPKVNFDIRLLKKIQLMEFPLIRNWISDLVNDSLKVSMVDPGHITIPLCNDPELLGRQSGYCEGVLTITLKGGVKGKATSDDQWCSVTLDKQKLRTKEISADVLWQEQLSMLVYSLQYDKLRIKIKGKRRFGPNYTVVEYILPLVRLNLEQDNEQIRKRNSKVTQMELEDDNIEGSALQIQFNYSSLPLIDVSSEIDQESFQKNFIDKYYDDTPSEVTGVLFICVHSGTNLIPMDSSGTSDPYVMVFANKELVQMGHVVEETLNPQWDTRVEFFTADYTQTTLTFVVMDRNPMVLPNVLLADDNDDFMGSCNLKMTKFFGDPKKRTQEVIKKVGKLAVSVIFRPVSFIKHSIKSSVNEGFPEGESLHQKRTKLDAVTMEAILRQERGSLTISILRARNLMALDLNGRSDPFVIVRVGTSKQEKYKSKVVYRTLNPVWNEQITLAMPQKHERVTVEVWDKDPLTQERLGSTHFNHDDLLHLGANENDKHWFDLDKAKSGEIQLQFAVTMPNKLDRLDGITEENEHIQSYSYGSDNSEEDFLILEQKQKTVEVDNVDTPSISKERLSSTGEDKSLKLSFSNSLEMSTESNGHENGFTDFSGEPSKYYGIHGEIIELICLNVHDIDEVYIKIKLDSTAKFSKPTRRTLLTKSERVLCRTSFYQVDTRMNINEQFQTKSDYGVSPCLYLIIEIKSEKKGKDVIDSHSMLLRNFFKGETEAVRTIELDNGGRIKLKLGHVVPSSSISSGLRKKFRRSSKFRTTIG